MNPLDITIPVEFDDRIIRQEYFSHKPYASATLSKNDEIRIVIQNLNDLTIPCTGYLYVEGKFYQRNGTATVESKLTRNAFAFLFQEVRYELNGVEVDRVRNVGITSTLKTYISASSSDLNGLENAGWFIEEPVDRTFDYYKRFSAIIPLKQILGFAEDMQRVIMNAKQELILIRSSTDNNSYTRGGTEENHIILDKLIWKMQHLSVCDEERLKLLKVMNANAYLPLSFRSWDLFEYPLLPISSKHSWAIKTSVQLETPRFVILAFQTDRKANVAKDSSVFDNCKLTNVKVFLNSEYYPYDNLHLDWDANIYSEAFDMYRRFRQSYYDGVKDENACALQPDKFKELAPVIVIDCSRQNEKIKQASVDLRVEFEAIGNFPANTAAYTLVLYDRIIKYSPLTGLVQRYV